MFSPHKRAITGDCMRICQARRRIHMGSFRHKTRVHSGTFRYIRDFSMTLPLTGDLGNREKYKYAWVHSVQPPQPYINLKGGRGKREGGKEHEWEGTSRNLPCSPVSLSVYVPLFLALSLLSFSLSLSLSLSLCLSVCLSVCLLVCLVQAPHRCGREGGPSPKGPALDLALHGNG